MTGKLAQNWAQNVTAYRQEERIAKVLTSLNHPANKADVSISEELRKLLVFANAAEVVGKHVRGPEDLEAVQSSINEIQSYRDRAVDVLLSATAIKGRLDRGWYIIQQVVSLKSEVQSKNQAIRDAIVGQTACELEDMISEWEVIIKQCDALIRNCRDAYNAIHTQVEVAKQMWFQGQRVDASAVPRAPKGTVGPGGGSKPVPLGKQFA